MLTQSQWLWLQCHSILDEGLLQCPACEALGAGPYCAACGTRMAADVQTCEACQMTGTGVYCTFCGAPFESMVSVQMTQGTFDWEQWAQSLAPFMHGITPKEQAMLGQG